MPSQHASVVWNATTIPDSSALDRVLKTFCYILSRRHMSGQCYSFCRTLERSKFDILVERIMHADVFFVLSVHTLLLTVLSSYRYSYWALQRRAHFLDPNFFYVHLLPMCRARVLYNRLSKQIPTFSAYIHLLRLP